MAGAPPDEAVRRAVALHKAGQVAAAEDAYRAILATDENVSAATNLATLLRARGDLDGALALLHRAVAAAPANGVVRRNLGNLHRDRGDLAAATAQYEAALQIEPADDQAAVALAEVLLAEGRFTEAWPLLERRPERAKAAARIASAQWQGEPLAGKRLLIWPEQGFGDQIMMMRFVPRLEGQAIVACVPQLARLLGQLPAEGLTLENRMMLLPPHDYWTVPMSLPGQLGVYAADLATQPYLSGQARRTGGVGVAWLGNARPDPARSLPPEFGAQLLALPGAVSLHPQDSGARDFQDTADMIAGLDLVVSIDTSVAHLAGAMGKPCLVLLHHRASEWRWRADAAGRSVWYPSATVLRQPAPGDWVSVIAQVKAAWPA